MWKNISHPNIVTFIGVLDAPAPFPMVSEWMPNGNVQEFITKNLQVSRLQLVRYSGSGLDSG